MDVISTVLLIVFIVSTLALLYTTHGVVRAAEALIEEYEDQLAHYREYVEVVERCLNKWAEEDKNVKN